MRIFAIPIMAAIFVGWVLYRWLIKKDIKQHMGDVVGGFMFLGFWALIYWWIWS